MIGFLFIISIIVLLCMIFLKIIHIECSRKKAIYMLIFVTILFSFFHFIKYNFYIVFDDNGMNLVPFLILSVLSSILLKGKNAT